MAVDGSPRSKIVVPARTRKRVEIVARFARSRAVRRLVPSKSVVSIAAEGINTLSTGLERPDAPDLAVFATRNAPLLKNDVVATAVFAAAN